MTVSTDTNKIKRHNKSTSSLHCPFLCASITYIFFAFPEFLAFKLPSWPGLSPLLGSTWLFKRDINGRIFTVILLTTLIKKSPGLVILNKRNLLGQEYTISKKSEGELGETVSLKKKKKSLYSNSFRLFHSSCSVNKSVQGKTHVLSPTIFASRHKTSLALAE